MISTSRLVTHPSPHIEVFLVCGANKPVKNSAEKLMIANDPSVLESICGR